MPSHLLILILLFLLKFTRTLLKWGASGVDLSSVVLQYFNQISERISTALCQLPIPASDATSADASLLIKTDLIFAYATDFWTACVSSTQLQYTYPTPSLNAIIPTNSVAPLTIPHISSTVPISYFKDYSHLISIIVESLGDYSVRRAYILSFCTQKMVDSNILDDLSAWDKMVALFASFVSKPSFEIFPYSEEALFTQYLKVYIHC